MSDAPATTQRAWIIERKGLPKNALVLRDWPIPTELREGEVLVKVEAAALNPVGYKLMGVLPNFIAKRPLPAEHDLAGVIEDANGSEFNKGDKVFGFIPVPLTHATRQGALQQYARMPAANLVLRPDNVTATQAAGFCLAGESAWQALFKCGQLQPGQTVLINGGSTAVGAFAIQIAKAKGAGRVVATASSKNEKYVLSLGADEVVDYTAQPLHEYFSKNPPSPKFDIIFETVGLSDPSLYTYSPAYLAPGGIFVSVTGSMAIRPVLQAIKRVGSMFWPAWLGGVPRRFQMVKVPVDHSPPDLKQMVVLIKEGKLKPLVDSVHEFENALEAYERLMSNRATGKVVVRIDPLAR